MLFIFFELRRFCLMAARDFYDKIMMMMMVIKRLFYFFTLVKDKIVYFVKWISGLESPINGNEKQFKFFIFYLSNVMRTNGFY